jgi:hypothetical protein
LENYKMAEQEQRSNGGVSISIGVPQWQKPNVGLTKINWDATLDKSREWMGVGVVA